MLLQRTVAQTAGSVKPMTATHESLEMEGTWIEWECSERVGNVVKGLGRCDRSLLRGNFDPWVKWCGFLQSWWNQLRRSFHCLDRRGNYK
jgi:hypothetical protein